MFKNHKWARLSCVHYTEWHFVLKCPGPWPPDCSPSPTHQQLARGSTLPTQLQARPCSSLPGPVLVPSKAICPIPPAPSQHGSETEIFPHDYRVCPSASLRIRGVPILNACDIRGPTSSLISSSPFPGPSPRSRDSDFSSLLLPSHRAMTRSSLCLGRFPFITQRSIFPADSSCSPTPTTCRFPTLLL